MCGSCFILDVAGFSENFAPADNTRGYGLWRHGLALVPAFTFNNVHEPCLILDVAVIGLVLPYWHLSTSGFSATSARHQTSVMLTGVSLFFITSDSLWVVPKKQKHPYLYILSQRSSLPGRSPLVTLLAGASYCILQTCLVSVMVCSLRRLYSVGACSCTLT